MPMREERKALERLAAFLAGLIVLLLVIRFLVPVVWQYFSPFIVALAIAAVLQRPIRLLEKKVHLKHSAAVMVPVLLTVLVLLAVFAWFLSYGITQMIALLNNAGPLISDGMSRLRAAISSMLQTMESYTDHDVAWIQQTSNNAISWLTEQTTGLVSWALGQVGSLASGIPFSLVYANFLFLGLYFVSKEYDRIRAHLPGGKKEHPSRSASAANVVTDSAVSGLIGFLRVQLIYAVEVMIVSEIFWQALGYQYAAVAAIAAGILEFIPLFGCGVLYIVWAVIALLVGDVASALQALGLYLGLLLIRRLTEPKIMSQSMGLSPLLSLVGMFAGMQLGGIFGLIGGPVVMTVIVVIVRGGYLSFIPRDIRTLSEWLRRRWGPNQETPPEPPQPPLEKAEEAPAAETPSPEEEAAPVSKD